MLSLALPSDKCFPVLCGTKALMPSMYQRIALLLVFLTPKSGCTVAEKACFYCTVSVVLFGVNPHSGAAHPRPVVAVVLLHSAWMVAPRRTGSY